MEWMPKHSNERPDKAGDELTPEMVDKALELNDKQREMLRAAIAQVREEEELVRSETTVPVSERAEAEFPAFEEHTRQTAVDEGLAKWENQRSNEKIAEKLPGYSRIVEAAREDVAKEPVNDNEREEWELDDERRTS